MKSSLPEVDEPYRKSDYSHRKWSYYVNGGGNVVGSSRLDTSWQDSLLLEVDSTLWPETRLQTEEIKQEAMQCIPRSVNLCRQVIRFNKTHVQETKLCIQTRSHPMYTSFCKLVQTSDTFQQNACARNKTLHPNKKPSNVYLVL